MHTGHKKYDVAVIGAGAGGVSAALRAARGNAKVVAFECDRVGGLCMNRGCIPLTHFMAASQLIADLDLAREMGLRPSASTMDLKALFKRQEGLLEYLGQGVEGMLKKAGVEMIRGRARIEAQGLVGANGKTYEAGSVIIAAGGRWKTPGQQEAFRDTPHNMDHLLAARETPRRAVLVGSSRWNLGAAQFLRRIGSEVTVATPEKNLLSSESKTVVSRLSKVLKREGIKILLKSEVAFLEKGRKTWHCVLSTEDTKIEIEADEVFSLDRAVSLEDMGLENIGLQPSADFLKVTDALETQVKGVYAIGDVTSPPERHFSHAAAAQGVVAADNALGRSRTFNGKNTPRVLFTRPQIASVGLTPKEAKEAGYDVITGLAALSMNPLGMILAQNEGAVEVVADKHYGEVLGIHIIGDASTEMIGSCSLALSMETTVEELAGTMFPHPTLSESLAEAARECLSQM